MCFNKSRAYGDRVQHSFCDTAPVPPLLRCSCPPAAQVAGNICLQAPGRELAQLCQELNAGRLRRLRHQPTIFWRDFSVIELLQVDEGLAGRMVQLEEAAAGQREGCVGTVGWVGC